MTFFVDQVEDFTSQAGAAKLQKNVKIIRDALIETEPFASRVSFVFQFHPDAYERLRDAWLHEDLRSLAWDEPLNAPYVIVLKGLQTFKSAKLLADKCLNHPSVSLRIANQAFIPSLRVRSSLCGRLPNLALGGFSAYSMTCLDRQGCTRRSHR